MASQTLQPTPAPTTQSSHQIQTSGKRDQISAIMKAHTFYTDRRTGCGPNAIQSELDRVCAISSKKIISKLSSKVQERQKQGKRKTAKPSQPTGKPPKRNKNDGPQAKETSGTGGYPVML